MNRVELSNNSKKFLKKCDKGIYERILNKIKELQNDAFPMDCKRILERKEKVFRVRVGDYRILYVVFQEKDLLFIADIDKQGRIY